MAAFSDKISLDNQVESASGAIREMVLSWPASPPGDSVTGTSQSAGSKVAHETDELLSALVPFKKSLVHAIFSCRHLRVTSRERVPSFSRFKPRAKPGSVDIKVS